MLQKIYCVTLRAKLNTEKWLFLEYEVDANTETHAFQKARKVATSAGYRDIRKHGQRVVGFCYEIQWREG